MSTFTLSNGKIISYYVPHSKRELLQYFKEHTDYKGLTRWSKKRLLAVYHTIRQRGLI